MPPADYTSKHYTPNTTTPQTPPYSYNELLFISAKALTVIVKAEKAKSETQYTTLEQYTPKQPTTTTDKLNNVLTSRTLRDLTYNLDPYKKNPSDVPLTTLTHILEHYDFENVTIFGH